MGGLEATGVTLNKGTYVFYKPVVKFLDHLISKDGGIRVDPKKTSAIREIKVLPSIEKILRHSEPAQKMFSTKCQINSTITQAPAYEPGSGGQTKIKLFEGLKRIYHVQQCLHSTTLTQKLLLTLCRSILDWYCSSWTMYFQYGETVCSDQKGGISNYNLCEKFTDYLLGCKSLIESDQKSLILLL